MATTTILNDLIDLNQTGNTTALKGCVGTNAQQPATPTISVQYLVVGGGGGGGSNGTASGDGLGGGGAGGFSTGTIAVPNNTAVNIVVGEGGLGGGQTSDQSGTNGQDSGFYTIQGQGGGGGGEGTQAGFPGGSGGGGGRNSGNLTNTGTGVSGQGNNGGLGGYTGGSYQASSGGGGGGASTVGATGGNSQSSAGAGGTGSDAVALGIITQANGITASIGEVDGATLNFSGGGGGGQASAGAANDGGLGGGGNGGTNSVGSVGTANTGGGGGGDGSTTQGGGGTGGSGVVILKYANTATETIAGSLAGGTTTGTTGTCDYPTTASILYQFEDNANNTCSGGTYDATAGANVSYSANGKYGKAVEFTASTASAVDVITVPDAIANLIINDFTISFWMKPDNLNYASQGYVNPIGFQKGRRFYIDISSAGAISSYNGNSALASANNTITTGSWFHVVYTQSSSTGRVIYVNGTLTVSDGTTADTTVYNPGGSENVIGGYKSSSAWALMFDGLIDQFRLFPSVLTADQVSMLYAENVGATKFTESSDTVLVFKGGSGTINLTDTSLPGPKVGDLRTNTDQSSADSASAMEHYMSTGWRVFTNMANPSSSNVNYPVANAALFQLNGNIIDSTSNLTASDQNITYAAGKFDQAALWNNAQTSYINTGFDISSKNFTISIWFNDPYANTSSWSYLFGTTGGGAINGYSINSSGGDLDIIIRAGSGQADIARLQGGSVSASTWHNVVLTFDNSGSGTNTLYLDGTAITATSGSNPFTGRPNSNSTTLYLGSAGSYNVDRGKDILIDQVRLFNVTLTQSQVTELYNET